MLNTNDMLLRRGSETTAAINYIDESMDHRIRALTANNDEDKEFFVEMADWAARSAEIAYQRANDWHRHL